jgi:hypothetical protein
LLNGKVCYISRAGT